jgi:hypothetical protein
MLQSFFAASGERKKEEREREKEKRLRTSLADLREKGERGGRRGE